MGEREAEKERESGGGATVRKTVGEKERERDVRIVWGEGGREQGWDCFERARRR